MAAVSAAEISSRPEAGTGGCRGPWPKRLKISSVNVSSETAVEILPKLLKCAIRSSNLRCSFSCSEASRPCNLAIAVESD